MVRLVHGQHVVGERADDSWHPPAKAGQRATVLAQGERLAVFQDAARQLLGGGNPDLADERKSDLDYRPGCPQPLEARGGIAQVVLTGEVHWRPHPRTFAATLALRLKVSVPWQDLNATLKGQAGLLHKTWLIAKVFQRPTSRLRASAPNSSMPRTSKT